MMEENNIKLTIGEVSELVINRPDRLNALNPDVLQGIILSFIELHKEPSVRALIITGEGPKAFVAGADVHTMNQLGPRALADYIELGQRAMRTIENARFPVIAAVNGFALGGGMELALACDIIYASPNAKLGLPEVSLGIIPGWGGTQRLIQRAGIGQTRKLVYSGEMINADEALRIGLVDKLCEEGQLLEQARSLAKVIASRGPLAVSKAKNLICRSQENTLLSGLQLEVETFLELFNTVDREEGMGAFLQKRAAKFVGK